MCSTNSNPRHMPMSAKANTDTPTPLQSVVVYENTNPDKSRGVGSEMSLKHNMDTGAATMPSYDYSAHGTEFVKTTELPKADQAKAHIYTFDIDSHDHAGNMEILTNMNNLSGVDIPQLYSTAPLEGNESQARFHAAFPLAVDNPLPTDVHIIRVEFRLPSESMSQLELLASLKKKQESASDTTQDDNMALDLFLHEDAIMSQAAHLFGGENFDKKAFHATILSARILTAVNSTGSTFRSRLMFPNMNAKDDESLYQTHATPQGLSSPSMTPSVTNQPEHMGTFAKTSSCQFHASLPAEHTGPLPSNLDVLYSIPSLWETAEARRWIQVDIGLALAEAEMFRVRNGIHLHVPEFEDPLKPRTLVEYILISHESELNFFSRQLNVEIPKLAQVHTVDKRDTGRSVYIVNRAAYILTLRHLHGLCSSFPVNLNAPMRLSLTMRDGASGWRDMAVNGLAHQRNQKHRPVRISVTVEFAMVPFTGLHSVSTDQEKNIIKMKDMRKSSLVNVDTHIQDLHESTHEPVNAFLDAKLTSIEEHQTQANEERQNVEKNMGARAQELRIAALNAQLQLEMANQVSPADVVVSSPIYVAPVSNAYTSSAALELKKALKDIARLDPRTS